MPWARARSKARNCAEGNGEGASGTGMAVSKQPSCQAEKRCRARDPAVRCHRLDAAACVGGDALRSCSTQDDLAALGVVGAARLAQRDDEALLDGAEQELR